MAEKRMLSKMITTQDEFLDMPLSAQALYFHLNMYADDEGFVDKVKSIMRQVRSTDDDLKILLAKRYLLSFNSGVVVIKHWLIHNSIRQDRVKDTLYQEERLQITVKENNSYTEIDRQLADNSQHSIESTNLNYTNLNLTTLIKDVIEYLNDVLNTHYRTNGNKIKSLIKARHEEGFTLEDFKIVIDKKYSEWNNDEKMKIYLRPETLFSNKFESYLNQKKVIIKKTPKDQKQEVLRFMTQKKNKENEEC